MKLDDVSDCVVKMCRIRCRVPRGNLDIMLGEFLYKVLFDIFSLEVRSTDTHSTVRSVEPRVDLHVTETKIFNI